MAKKRKNNFIMKRVGEIMEEMDSPHGGFDLGESFMKNGSGASSGPKPSQPLLNAFQQSYEPVDSEHMAQVIFSLGRLREYFGAWIIPKMPDPLNAYIEELDYMGYHMRVGFDGTSCIMVRYRGSVEVHAEEVTATECTPCGLVAEDAAYVYTDEWKDDLNDLPLYGEVKENNDTDKQNRSKVC